MVQEITKEFLAEKAVEYAEQKNSAWTNDCEGFIAGAMFVMQLLKQTDCTTQLPPITDGEYKRLMKALYPADNSKKFNR